MADLMMRMAGRGEDGLAKAIRVDGEGSLEVSQKGVKLLKEHNGINDIIGAYKVIGETITDGAAETVPIMTPFPEKTIWVKNNTDVDVSIDYLYLHGANKTKSNYMTIPVSIKIPKGEALEIDKEDIDKLGEPAIGISFRLLAGNSTTGTVDVKVLGSNTSPYKQPIAKILKQFIGDKNLVAGYRVYGDNVRDLAYDVNPILTPYSDKIIWIRNNTDVTIRLDKLYLYGGDKATDRYDSVDANISIPSGESKEITKNDIRRLGEPVNGISFRLVAGNSTTGDVDIKVFGGQGGSDGFTGDNATNGEGYLRPSLVEDNDGYGVLRTVDAAPFAYDPDTNSKIVRSLSKKRKIIVFADGYLPPSEDVNINRYYPTGNSDFYRSIKSSECDVRDLKNINITIHNALDVSCNVQIVLAVNAGSNPEETQHVVVPETPIEVLAGKTKRLAGDEYPFLNRTFGYMSVRALTTGATEGGLYITVEGEER